MINQTAVNDSSLDMFRLNIPKAEVFLFGCTLSLLIMLITLGNALVWIVFWRFRNLRNLTNYFVCSLAVADILVPFLRVVYIVISIFKERWIFGLSWCEISSMCGVLLCGSSILHLCAISIERLIAIKWPLSYNTKVTSKRVIIVLSYIWIQSSLLSIIPVLPIDIAQHRFNPDTAECEIDWHEDPKLTLLLIFFYFFVPINIMIIAYATILKEARRNTRRVQTFHLRVNGKSTFSVFKKELKAVKTLAVVIGVFFVMWMPFFVTTTIRAFKPERYVSGWLQRLVMTLAYANSACNFVIYALMNFHYRSAFVKVFAGRTGARWIRSNGILPSQNLKNASRRIEDQSTLKQFNDQAWAS
ncbi:histamine H2 receptor-like [Actinia tenebrosa]|uniref:Histamine H2 receptor-like n=1 Tax=Actinia tenebrosa TaxID=6105 RepID=A0A6P8IMT5_ACTTE|nr:histamine H2 receptor-like [Actinia tenebrosa]